MPSFVFESFSFYCTTGVNFLFLTSPIYMLTPVPRWLIDELFPNEPEENYMMHCPECDHKMIVKK